MEVRWLGEQEYRAAWELQRELAARRLAGDIEDTLLLLTHPPTLTLGRSAGRANLLATSQQLADEGVQVVESDRGGDITYHGPGQLVGYPILNLQDPPHTPDLHAYLRRIEAALIDALASSGVAAGRFPPHTGVWVGLDGPEPEKIAAIGVRASRWITQHGFALNVDPEMRHFDLIVPCGIQEYGVTSLARVLGRPVSVEATLDPVIAAFRREFDLER